MAPKLLLDEHLSPTIGHRLTLLLFDVTSVRDRGLAGLDDWLPEVEDIDLLNQFLSLSDP